MRQDISGHISAKSEPFNVIFFLIFYSFEFVLITYILLNIYIFEDLGPTRASRKVPRMRAHPATLRSLSSTVPLKVARGDNKSNQGSPVSVKDAPDNSSPSNVIGLRVRGNQISRVVVY